MKTILGSHNSMSYLKPAKWYMRLFNFVAKCQDYDIVKQHSLGVRCFDIRISIDDMFRCKFAHGLIDYKSEENIDSVFNTINQLGDCYVRVIFECNRFTKHKYQKYQCFKSILANHAHKYKNIKFFGGNMKYSWYSDPIDNFIKAPTHVQRVGSMAKNKLYSIFPRWYAKKHNKSTIDNIDKEVSKITFIDFIGRYY